jgi:hypothetical protein
MEQQRIEQQMELTREEEQFLIHAEQEEHKKPCFDARALRQMGLPEAQVGLVQLFFMKARGVEFNVRRFTKSECLQALVFALKYLPRTAETGTVSVESYKHSDNIYNHETNADKWCEGFRHEFGHALIWSHKERREPALLVVLTKVFDWVEKFQKAHGLYQELPQWLQDGMKGDFKTDSWIGSDLYEGTKTREEYWKEQDAQQHEPASAVSPAVSAAKHAHEAPIEHPPCAPAPTTSTPQPQQITQATLSCTSTEAPQTHPQPKEQCILATEKQKALLKKLMAKRSMPLASLAIDTLTKKDASRRIDELFQHNAEDAQEMAA